MKTKLKRVVSSIIVTVLMMSTVFSLFSTTASAAGVYVPLTDTDRKAIAAYARDMCENPSEKRTWFDAYGGDCTSFTSNCLLAAGLTWDEESGTPWYFYDMSNRAPAWAGSDAQEQYIGEHQSGSTGLVTRRVYKGSPSGINTQILEGDLIFFDYEGNGSSMNHSAIITTGGSSSGAIRFASHSAGSIRSFSTWTSTNTVAIYRIEGYYPDSVPAGKNDIRPDTYKEGSCYLQTAETEYTKIIGGEQNRHYIITIQGYIDYSTAGQPFGYCTSVDKNFNGHNNYTESGSASAKLTKALSYGLSDKKQSYTAVNNKLGVSLQNNAEAFYVTQMGVWYALGQVSYDGSTIKLNGYAVQTNPDSSGASRVLAATKKLFDIIDNGSIPTPPTTAPNLDITPPSPHKAVYNSTVNAFIAGPYSVSVSGGSTYDVSFSQNGVGATVVNSSFNSQTTFNVGEKFYIKVPNTAGIATLKIKAEADVTVAPKIKTYTPSSHADNDKNGKGNKCRI